MTGVQAFGGIARVTSEMFEDREPIWPQGKKKKRRRGRRLSKARHESGGFGEYRPKASADRSLTLLVVVMLLVLAALVVAAVLTLWPQVWGARASSAGVWAPRVVGGP